MKIVNNRLTALVAGIFLFSACQSLSEYEMNPNSPSEGQVPPTLILTSVISNTLGSYRLQWMGSIHCFNIFPARRHRIPGIFGRRSGI